MWHNFPGCDSMVAIQNKLYSVHCTQLATAEAQHSDSLCSTDAIS